MKKIFNRDTFIFVIMFISLFAISFYTDIYTRGLVNIDTYNFNNLRCRSLWLGFSISWIFIILLIIYILPKKKRIKTFSIVNILLDVLFFAQICYVQQLGKYMIFSDLFLAGEGLQYVKSIFLNLNFGMIATIIFNIFCIVALNMLDRGSIINASKERINNPNKIILISIIVIILLTRLYSYFALGRVVETNSWQENYNTKNIYVNYTNPNTSMFVSGFYEYHFRAVYKYIYNLLTLDKTALKVNVDKYNDIYGISNNVNDYTGMLKDKSVIYIMMESIDSWIVDEETMPTLKYMMDTGINFTNRYSPFFNGGQTINSEFALNTGMYAISDKDTIYDIDDVDYPYSLANTLSSSGYKVNSFHANTGNFYNRTSFHKRLGYQHHYSALDMQRAGILDNEQNYFSDSIFISDDYLFNLIASDDKYMSFITTYSAHLEYTEENKIYKGIKQTLDKNKYGEEEYIYRTLAKDTDKALSILIKKLEEAGKLDDVVLVLVSDHYVYGYSDSEYVSLKKNVINDRKELQNTPFVIWAEDIGHMEVDTILDTADILPTVYNLLGIDYNPNYYMGTDVFSNTHDDFVWFSDGSFIKSKNCSLSDEAILTKINYNISKNKSILLTNYYGN